MKLRCKCYSLYSDCATCKGVGHIETDKLPPLKYNKAYNSHRLSEMGGEWVHTVDNQGYQFHFCMMPDGSTWLPRVATQYYTIASGKLMMVCALPGG